MRWRGRWSVCAAIASLHCSVYDASLTDVTSTAAGGGVGPDSGYGPGGGGDVAAGTSGGAAGFGGSAVGNDATGGSAGSTVGASSSAGGFAGSTAGASSSAGGSAGSTAGASSSAGGSAGSTAGASSSAGGSAGSAGNASGGVTGQGGQPPSDAGAERANVADAGAADISMFSDAGSIPDASCSPSNPLADYCAQVPMLGAPPVLDGQLDCGPQLRTITPVGWSSDAGAIDTVAQYAVAWRPDGLYFYVLVQDPALVPAEPADLLWKGDSVELFVDNDGRYTAPPTYDEPGTRQMAIASPSSSTPTSTRAQMFSFNNTGYPVTWSSTEFAAYTKTGGYAVEAFVRAADLGLPAWPLSAGQSVGFDISIDVSYPNAAVVGAEGHRLGQYFLHLDSNTSAPPPYSNPLAFCTPTLLSP